MLACSLALEGQTQRERVRPASSGGPKLWLLPLLPPPLLTPLLLSTQGVPGLSHPNCPGLAETEFLGVGKGFPGVPIVS